MRALLLEQQDDQTLAHIKDIDSDRLPEGDVTVDINWSSLNYKDALAITGKGKIVRNFPMVPGIDFAGTVRHNRDDRFKRAKRGAHRLGRGRTPLGRVGRAGARLR